MSQTGRVALKQWFETGDQPSQAQFGDLIDSFFNFIDDVLGNIADADGDTYINVEESSDDDIINMKSGLASGILLILKKADGTPIFQINADGNISNNGKYLSALLEETNIVLQTRSAHGSITGTAEDNIFIGLDAGGDITIGVQNVALGSNAGGSLTEGSWNTLVGYVAGQALTTQHSNTLIGYQAGQRLQGIRNICIGSNAGGRQVATDNHLFITSRTYANIALELSDGLVVGEFSPTRASQWLRINGALETNGTRKELSTKVNDYSLTAVDEVIILDGNANTVTATLPAISAINHGQKYTLKTIDISFLCDIDTTGADAFEDTTTNFAFATPLTEIINLIADNDTKIWRQI